MHCDQNISRSRPDFDDPNGESVAPEAANMPSKFEQIPTVNESGISVLVRLLCQKRELVSLLFSLFLKVVLSQNLLSW